MPINTPSPPSSPFFIGKGLQFEDGSTLMIYGQSLPNFLSDLVTGMPGPWNIVTPTTLFDVTGIGGLDDAGDHYFPSGYAHYGIDNEVVCFLCRSAIGSGVNVRGVWSRYRDGATVFTFERNADSTWYGFALWIGWLSPETQYALFGVENDKEIDENGDYNVKLYLNDTLFGQADFAITGITARTILRNPTYSSFAWKVVTTDYFKTSNYMRVGVCTQPFTDGQSAQPSGIWDYQTAPASFRGCAATGSITNLSQGTTYTLYGFAQAANGRYYQAGSMSITTKGAARPANFAWHTSKVAGGAWPTAAEWNGFTARINEFRRYKWFSQVGFITGYSGNPLTGAMFNQVRNNIAVMSTAGLPGEKSAGDKLYASELNNLVACLNSIP